MRPTDEARPLRIAVADDERDVRQFFAELLPPMGHEVVAVAQNGRELIEMCQQARPELVITDIKMPDIDGIQAAAAINQDAAVPVILLTGQPEAQSLARAGEDYIMAYLSKPAKPVDLQAAISMAMFRFAHVQKLRQETVDLRQALEDRKLIERAKGAVMKRLQLNEEDAYRRLRIHASEHNKKLVEVCREVTAAEEAFRVLEQIQ